MEVSFGRAFMVIPSTYVYISGIRFILPVHFIHTYQCFSMCVHVRTYVYTSLWYLSDAVVKDVFCVVLSLDSSLWILG